MKETLFSERNMKLINAVCLTAMLVSKSGKWFNGFILWAVYLILCAIFTRSKGIRIVYLILLAACLVLLVLNYLICKQLTAE